MSPPILIDPQDIPKQVVAQLRKHRARLREAVGDDEQRGGVRIALLISTEEGEEDVLLSPELTRAFATALAEVAEGHTVQMEPVDEVLTTSAAADLLNVSRPHLVKLLEEGAIPHWKVGAHRRVRRADVLAYRDAVRRDAEAALQQLADQAQELGLGYE